MGNSCSKGIHPTKSAGHKVASQYTCVSQVNEECSTLRVTLATAQHERESAKEQVSTLQTRVNSLENLVRVRDCLVVLCT
nr:hypothetical protein BaRGS_005647 [Batillaria attramentaria]